MPDQPLMIFWRMGGVVLTSVYGPIADVAEARDKDGCKANHIICRRQGRPYGATGWRLSGETAWRPLETCPVPANAPVDVRSGGVGGKPMQSKYGR